MGVLCYLSRQRREWVERLLVASGMVGLPSHRWSKRRGALDVKLARLAARDGRWGAVALRLSSYGLMRPAGRKLLASVLPPLAHRAAAGLFSGASVP